MSESEIKGLVPAEELADLDEDGLRTALVPLFEDAGPLADALVGRSFESWQEVIEDARQAIEEMDDATLSLLLVAHPRLGTSPTTLKQRGTLSFVEQGGAALTSPWVLERLEALNDAYETKFGFPLVEWVAGRTKEEMLPVLEARLAGDRPVELRAGAEALVAIATDRLSRLRSEGS